MESKTFKSERTSQTASFVIEENIATVFPLFDAFEERKWEKNWNPQLIYPETEKIEVGTTFYIEGKGEEGRYLWRVIQFDPAAHLIQYFVSTEHRDWTISVQCESIKKGKGTRATVTYTFIGLTSNGNQLNKDHIERMYNENLQDWKRAIDVYLNLN